jgi:hypothetical protein
VWFRPKYKIRARIHQTINKISALRFGEDEVSISVEKEGERERDRCTRAHVYYNNNRLQRDGCASPIHHKCHMPAAQSGFCINLRTATFYKPNGPFYFIFFSILFFSLSKTTSLSLSLSLSLFFYLALTLGDQQNKKRK